MKNQGKNDDVMVRVPKALMRRYEQLQKKDSWRSFPAFVREAVRTALDRHEAIERDTGKK